MQAQKLARERVRPSCAAVLRHGGTRTKALLSWFVVDRLAPVIVPDRCLAKGTGLFLSFRVGGFFACFSACRCL